MSATEADVIKGFYLKLCSQRIKNDRLAENLVHMRKI